MRAKIVDKSRERGAALILALMVLALLTIMAMGALFTAGRSIEMAGADRSSMEAFYVADAGMNRMIVDMLKVYELNKSFLEQKDLNGDGNDDFSEKTTGSVVFADLAGAPTLDNWMNLAGV